MDSPSIISITLALPPELRMTFAPKAVPGNKNIRVNRQAAARTHCFWMGFFISRLFPFV
jgi:hypothetical protein